MYRILLVLLSLSCFDAVAANDRVKARSSQYKCHLLLKDGTQVVNYLMAKDNFATGLTHQLAGKYIYAKDGVSKRTIEKVHQCVAADEQFVELEARLLDEQTLK